MEHITLANQKELSGTTKRQIREEAGLFEIALYHWMVNEWSKFSNTPSFELSVGETSHHLLRGLPFQELKRLIRQTWPHMAHGLVERTRGVEGRVIEYPDYERHAETYVNSNGTIVLYLTRINKYHANYFVISGDKPEIEEVRNLIDCLSRPKGYFTIESKVLQFRRLTGD